LDVRVRSHTHPSVGGHQSEFLEKLPKDGPVRLPERMNRALQVKTKEEEESDPTGI